MMRMVGAEGSRDDRRHHPRNCFQLWLSLEIFGELAPKAAIGSREDHTFNDWRVELDGKVLRNLLTAAERLA